MIDRPSEEQESESTQVRGGARTASAGGDPSHEKDQEQLQHEIEETRAELGDTVDALAQKADVKARVSEKVEQRKEDVKASVNGARERASRATEEHPFPAIAVALGLGLLIGRAIGRR